MMPAIGLTESGREIHGSLGTESLAANAGRFRHRELSKGHPDKIKQRSIWLGGEVTMPYWTNDPYAPHLTADEISRYLVLQ